MSKQTIADLVAATLADAGVERIWGVTGQGVLKPTDQASLSGDPEAVSRTNGVGRERPTPEISRPSVENRGTAGKRSGGSKAPALEWPPFLESASCRA